MLALFAAPAHAQSRQPVKLNFIDGLLHKLQEITLADLQAADAIALAHGNQIAHQCWTAWIQYIQADQAATVGPDGNPVVLPSIHLITDLQRAFDLQQALQPTSPLSVSCAPFKNAAIALALPIPFLP